MNKNTIAIAAALAAVCLAAPAEAHAKTSGEKAPFKLFPARDKARTAPGQRRGRTSKETTVKAPVQTKPAVRRPAPSVPRSINPVEGMAEIGRSIRKMFVRTTAYTHTESDHLEYGNKNAIGTTLQCRKDYTSAAADWSRFPLGTKFRIVGDPTVYVVDDCGGALWGTSTIDIYKPSMSAMHAWGTRHVEIEILDFGKNKS